MKNNIRKLKKIYNLTQENLADKTDVSRQTIIAIEKEKYDPSLKLALKNQDTKKTLRKYFYIG